MKRIFQLSSLEKIQAYLDSIEYSPTSTYRCPVSVYRDGIAHCFDGAVFAAAALREIGYPPLIVNMFPNDRDDEHLVAIFKKYGSWGAVGKSNFTGLRFREPVYRTLRELMMSYFEHYFNIKAERTLRGYARPLNLSRFDSRQWVEQDQVMEDIALHLGTMKVIPLVTPAMVRGLHRIDPQSFKAGTLGSDYEGFYKP